MRKSCLYTAVQAIKERGNKSIPLADKNATEGNSRNVSKELNGIIPCLSDYLKKTGFSRGKNNRASGYSSSGKING